MKIRLKEKSIRLRLSPQDIKTLVEDQLLREKVEVSPAAQLCFQIHLMPQAENSSIQTNTESKSQFLVSLQVPSTSFLKWIKDPQPLEWDWTEGELNVSIEKDLKPDRK
jgi:hypothetical protein